MPERMARQLEEAQVLEQHLEILEEQRLLVGLVHSHQHFLLPLELEHFEGWHLFPLQFVFQVYFGIL